MVGSLDMGIRRTFAWGAVALAFAAQAPAPAAQQAATARAPIDLATLGPQVGQQVPDFRLPDQDGRVWTRQSIMGQRGAMLVFFRSADW